MAIHESPKGVAGGTRPEELEPKWLRRITHVLRNRSEDCAESLQQRASCQEPVDLNTHTALAAVVHLASKHTRFVRLHESSCSLRSPGTAQQAADACLQALAPREQRRSHSLPIRNHGHSAASLSSRVVRLTTFAAGAAGVYISRKLLKAFSAQAAALLVWSAAIVVQEGMLHCRRRSLCTVGNCPGSGLASSTCPWPAARALSLANRIGNLRISGGGVSVLRTGATSPGRRTASVTARSAIFGRAGAQARSPMG